MNKNIRKTTVKIIFIFMMLFIGFNNVEALENKDVNSDVIKSISEISIQKDILGNMNKNIFILEGEETAGCDLLLSTDTKAFLNKILGYVKIFAPLLVIILGMLDFIKATVSQDNDALKKAWSKFFKRLIAAALLFIFPALIQFLLDIVKIDGVTYCKL
jgi:hypothetical protein